jgi:hypothetical protein
MNNVTISPISFNGLIVKGAVSGNNITKLGDFASRVENINFIKDLEKDFNVDAVLNSDITQMSFEHKLYGNLSGKYGGESFPLENVFRDAMQIILNIKSSVKKAAADWEKKQEEIKSVKRGC